MDRVIGGKYAVEGVLGRGGMGLVLKARHLRLDEPVAIKVLHSSLVNDPSMAARMLREARAALRLSSEHIVRVMDVDTLENGVPYMVLEYLEGYDVASLAKKRQAPMAYEHVVAIMEQACRALAEAHSLGIVHRDLKPANLFIVKRPDGRRVVKLLDFGVAKLDLPREAPITKKGDILGSPRYMSPEQVRGRDLDGRSDIWSAGVVLYELLTGAAPFAAPNFAVACKKVVEDNPPSILTLRPDLPPGLAAVVERCLQKDPERRFTDALALRDAITPFGFLGRRSGSQMTLPDLGDLISSDAPAGPVMSSPVPSLPPSSAPFDPLSAPSIEPSSAPPASIDPSTASLVAEGRLSHDATEIAQRLRSRRFKWVALVGLAVGLAIGAAMLVQWGRSSTASDAPTAATQAATSSATSVTIAPTIAAPLTSATISAAPASDAAPAITTTSAASAPADTSSNAKAQRRGAASAPPAKPPPSGADPFGERRQ